MKKLTLFLSLCLTGMSFAQDYFQQKVAYTIDVKLYDKENILRGNESFEYTNNSPNSLDFIYVHLWPNGYKNNETALAYQLYDMKNMALEFASEAERGFIDSLDFKVNDQKVEWMLDSEHVDFCKVMLNTPLKPGETMTVSTPFKVKIPTGDISRLGFVGESYQITQWYPKPAVYDKNGWHQMPYLTQGEFYSEYGTFDVSITLPKNYVVGATGDLQTSAEIDFLTARAEETQRKFKENEFNEGRSSEFPKSDKEWKTIRYTQSDVHDFAWFADKRFEVLKGEVELPNEGAMVTSWAMFVPHHADLWEDAIEYLNDATFYYSKWNGDYPYKHVTAVDGTISAGGGMEYPNVTVIGNSSSKEELEIVIVHEVGHNWFYGLLGSNERDHAWMDEGLNTLNEIRYIETKYPGNTRLSDMARGIVGKLHFEDLGHHDMSDLTYQLVAGFGLDQPIELHSAEYTSLNYGAIVYSKTGLVFTYLKDYLGDELFDKAMHAYYDEWHYKHPQPEDIQKVLERETGRNLSWLFDDLIKTTKQLDFKIKSVKMENGKSVVKVKNVGQIDAPIRVDAMSFGKVIKTTWVEPGDEVATFEGVAFDQFVIDAHKQIPETNRNNNYWTKKGLFHKTEPFKMEFIGGDNEGDKWNSFWMPALGVNVYDKFMIGAVFHNQTVPKNKLEYTLAPMYSIGRKTIAGVGDINYSWIPAKNVRMITLGVLSKTFGTDLNNSVFVPEPSTYYTLQPYLNFEIGKPYGKKYYSQSLKIQGHYIREIGDFVSNSLLGTSIKYGFRYAKRKQKVTANARLDYFSADDFYSDLGGNSTVANLGLEGKYTLEYSNAGARNSKSVSIRAFVGMNLLSQGSIQSRYGFALGGQSGTQDIFYEQYMFGRNRMVGLWSNQRVENHGNFKTTSNFGTTNGTLLAVNVYAQLPYIPIVGFYTDYGMFDNAGNMESVTSLGVGLKLAQRLAVYFPLYESENLRNAYPVGTKYGNKIRFTLDLTGFKLSELVGNAF